MKFEIDDKTGMLLIRRGLNINSVDKPTFPNTIELEQILQAVKKTQEKLVNIQIQEIQDSKNPHQLRENEVYIKDGYKTMNITDNVNDSLALKEKIEQNQKIVDKLVNFCNMVNIAEENSGTDNFINNIEHMQVASLTIQDLIKETTGKDIKELE